MTDTKNEILKECLGYFLQFGIWEMSNNKLASLLGISTKTLYKYFKNKEDLVAQALELFYSQQYEQLKKVPEKDSAAVILLDIWWQGFEMEFEVNNKLFFDLHHYYPELEKKVETNISKIFWNHFIKIFNRGIEEGDLRRDIDPKVVLEGISVLYISIVRKREFQKFNLSPIELLRNTIASYVRGICTIKGLRILDKHVSAFNSLGNQNALKKQASLNS